MLYRNILISHALGLVLSRDQYLVQILAHIDLTALYLDTLFQCCFGTVDKMLLLDFHFLDQL